MAHEIRLDGGFPLVTEAVDGRSLVRRVAARALTFQEPLTATIAHPDTGFATMRDGRRVICL